MKRIRTVKQNLAICRNALKRVDAHFAYLDWLCHQAAKRVRKDGRTIARLRRTK